MERNIKDVVLPVSVILVLIGSLLGMVLYRRYLRAHRGKALPAWLVALVLVLWILIGRCIALDRGSATFVPANEFEGILWLAGGALLPLFAVLFVVKLYCQWVGGEVSTEEKAGGMEGIRAWLRGGSLFYCLLIAACAWKGFGYPFWGIFALTIAARLLYPLLNQVPRAATPEPMPPEDLASERERVLKLLEEGKINAGQSAELLNALGDTVRSNLAKRPALTPARKILLAGGALVLLGFFLPWFSINPGNEVNRVTQQIQQIIPGVTGPDGASFLSLRTPSYSLAGPDIAHGLGWLVLILGIGAVAAMHIPLGLERQTQSILALAALGIGAIILIYLLTQNLRFVNAGVVVCSVGYALALVGVSKDWPA